MYKKKMFFILDILVLLNVVCDKNRWERDVPCYPIHVPAWFIFCSDPKIGLKRVPGVTYRNDQSFKEMGLQQGDVLILTQ
jgi:hypothetical protein